MKKVQNKSKWLAMLGITMLVSLTASTISYGTEKPEYKVLQEILVKMPGAINFLASGIIDPFEGTAEKNPLRWIIYNASTAQLDIMNHAYEATVAGKEFSIDPQSEDAKVILSFPEHVRKYLVERLNIKGMEKIEYKVLQEILSKMPGAINFLASQPTKIGDTSPFAGTTENNPLRWIIYNATTPQLDFINRAYKAMVANEEFIIASQSEDEKVMLSFPKHVRTYLLERLNIRGIDIEKAAQAQLINAILNGKLDEVRQAISTGADVNHMDSDGKTPAWLALLLGKFDIVAELLESSAKSNVVYRDKEFAQTVFYRISVYNPDPFAIKCLSLLLLNGVDFSQINFRHRNKGMAGFIIELIKHGHGLDQYTKPNTLELIQQLVKHGYNIVDKMWDSGESAIYQDKDLVELCLENGVNINQNINNWTSQPLIESHFFPMPALFVVIIAGTGKAIENLIDAGVDINQLANPNGKGMQTPLDWALSNETPIAIRILMQRGAKTASQLQ